MINNMTFPIYILATTPQNISGLFDMRNGPGRTPAITNAAIIIAVAAPPGIPRVSMGAMDPPVAALSADSEAATPSMAPVPNFSGVFEKFFATV